MNQVEVGTWKMPRPGSACYQLCSACVWEEQQVHLVGLAVDVCVSDSKITKKMHIPLFHDNRNADRMVYCKHIRYIYSYLQESFMKYCWWEKSFTSWYLVYPIVCKVLYIPDGVVFERFLILSRANLAIWTNPWTFGSQMARSSSLWLAAQLAIHGGHGLTWGMVG